MSEQPNAASEATQPGGPPLPFPGREVCQVPERIGKFKILGRLAAGMSLVYKAEQDRPHRLVALKLPRGGKLMEAEVRQRFLREISLAAKLDHPAIVPVLEVEEIDGTPYYTMPFVEGRSWDEWIKIEQPNLAKRLDVFLRLCDVVQALHAENLVHRDLKPTNLMIDRHGEVRLLDFGLAKVCLETTDLTREPTVHGTPQCMAPEQTGLVPSREITTAADVYALGVILYWLLTDQWPYRVDEGYEMAFRNIRELMPAPPSQLKPALTPQYDSLVLECLTKKAAKRPQTAGLLAQRLRMVLSGNSTPPPEVMSRSKIGAILLMIGGMVAMSVPLLLAFPKTGRPPEPPAPFPSPTNTPVKLPTLPAAASLQIQVFGSAQLLELASQYPVPATNTVGPALVWPLQQIALAELRTKASLAACGAIVLDLTSHRQIPGPGYLTCNVNRESTNQDIRAGEAVILYAAANHACCLELILEGNVSRYTNTLIRSQVIYQKLP